MPDRTNKDRAEDAERALLAHLEGKGPLDDPPVQDIIDLITDLLHYAVQHDCDPDEIISSAKMHLGEEIQEEADCGPD